MQAAKAKEIAKLEQERKEQAQKGAETETQISQTPQLEEEESAKKLEAPKGEVSKGEREGEGEAKPPSSQSGSWYSKALSFFRGPASSRAKV